MQQVCTKKAWFKVLAKELCAKKVTKVRKLTEGKCVEVDYKGPVEATVFFFCLVSFSLARWRFEKVVK